MPVVSKPIRARNASPILGPRPYKSPRQAWSASDTAGHTAGTQTNGDSSGDNSTQASPTRPKGSILRNGSGNASPTFSKPHNSVTFRNDTGLESKPPVWPRKPRASPIQPVKTVLAKARPALATTGADADSATEKSALKHKRSSLCLADMVKECEEHTDWVNSVLSDHNLPLISDLRTSVGDGYTLPALLEIIGGVFLKSVQTSPKTKEDRVRNLRNCLEFLCKRGVDISDLDPADLEDGDLKSVLILIGNIRKHFKTQSRVDVNGYAEHLEDPTVTEKGHTMPGAVKLPGAVPTPFLSHRGENGPRNGQPEPGPRYSAFQEVEMLPGMLGNSASNTSHHSNLKPHSNIISTTEIGMNGVAQHGVDERKSHFAINNSSSNNNSRGVVIRHPNAKGVGQTMTENPGAPPSAAQRAWMDSPVRHGATVNGVVTGPSVEDRLRELITKQPSSGGQASRQNLAFPEGGGYFHCGGSEVFDVDGEVLEIPPPVSRGSGVFDSVVLGEHSYGPGYRHPSNQHERQRSQPGYVPSKPTEKLEGSRADIIRSRPPSAIAFRQKKPGPQVASFVNQNRPRSAMGELASSSYNGHDNNAFEQESGPRSSEFGDRTNRAVGNNTTAGQSIQKSSASNDLRSACSRLYGSRGPPPPYQSPQMKRGDNHRSSQGQQWQQRERQNNNQFAAPPQVPPASRPQSAPAPAHMSAYFMSHDRLNNNREAHSHDELDGHISQGHHHSVNQRESPTGQSSSTQGHLDESSSSQQSKLSHENVPKNLHVQTSGDSSRKISQSSPSTLSQPSPKSPASPNYAIGPASKYPEITNSRPSSARKPPSHSGPTLPPRSPQRPDKPGILHKTQPHSEHTGNGERKLHNVSFPGFNGDISGSLGHINTSAQDLTTSLQAASKEHRLKIDSSYDRCHNQSHDLSQDLQNHSIFDYTVHSRSESSGSVTPPLPPLSPTNTPPDSPSVDPGGSLPRSISATNVSSGDVTLVGGEDTGQKRKQRRTSELNFRMAPKPASRRSRKGLRSKGANLNSVKESDSGSNLSFDIDDTFLTIESHDTEQPHPAGDLLTSQEVSLSRQQYNDLEFKFHDLQTKVNTGAHVMSSHFAHGKGLGPGQLPIGRQRRWSIGSSDTSSFRRESKFKPGKQIHHKHHSREFKNINKRFQKLESHVVTLARSVAHLSNELRTHNTMVNDLESVKRQLQELRDNPSKPFPNMMASLSVEHERFRDSIPGLTNPKRVNKLTKFFGAEPPLLEIFLKKLGYERYVPNFQSEHIGMIELPYMTEDRLEKIGVPMGPRIRILQEAQQCFRQENFDIYIV